MPEHRELPRDLAPIGESDGGAASGASLGAVVTPGGAPPAASVRPITMGGDPPFPPPRAISRRARAALPLSTVGAGMCVRRLQVAPRDVVFVKGVVEASDGLAGVFAEQGGDLLLAAPVEREGELVELLADLEAELSPPGQGGEAARRGRSRVAGQGP